MRPIRWTRISRYYVGLISKDILRSYLSPGIARWCYSIEQLCHGMGHSIVVVCTVAGLNDKTQISVCLSSNVVKLIRFLFLFMLCMSYDWYVLMTKDMNTDRMIWN